MILLELLWSFAKIGFTSFGGLSMVPLINSEMLSHGWMDAREVSDIIAIAEMTPGPLGLNCATFAGMRTAGIPGAMAANFGVLLPTLTLCLIAAIFFQKFKNGKTMQHIMIGVRPVCMGLIVGVMITMLPENYLSGGSVSLRAVLIGVAASLGLAKKLSIPLVIAISAVLGILLVR